MLIRLGFIFILSVSLAGCKWITWLDYNSNFRGAAPTSTAAGCPAQIGVQNLNSQQEAAILDAVGVVCEIFADEEFAQDILAKDDWLATCKMPNGMPDTIAAAEVLRIVRLPKADVSFHDRRPLSSIAQIDPSNSRVSIPKNWYRNWQTGTRQQRSEVVATIAHELTHFVRENGQANYLFQDGGWQRCDPEQENLASYGVGKMAQAFWLRRNPE